MPDRARSLQRAGVMTMSGDNAAVPRRADAGAASGAAAPGWPSIVLVAVPAAALAAAAFLSAVGASATGRMLLAVAIVLVLARLLQQITVSLLAGELGLDVIAALAMAGTLVAGEWVAGAVVALMYAGGQALEARAQARAQESMTALLAAVPKTARVTRREHLAEIPVADIEIGDRVLIAPGEVVPVDGRVGEQADALLDTSALTGEPMPVAAARGAEVLSGSRNAGHAFMMVATRVAADSAYARIVQLVEAARKSKAPLSRLADRYAVGFLAVTLLLAVSAWLLTGDVTRALAVLVVATPCPLILAVPVAIVAGMSRAATRGILVKSAAGIEALARCRTVLLDKTGTLTSGSAAVTRIEVFGAHNEANVLRLAAGLAQGSRHVLAVALVDEARRRGLALPLPDDIEEHAGAGLSGRVEGWKVVLGRRDFAFGEASAAIAAARSDPTEIAISIAGKPSAVAALDDPIRADAAAAIARLRDLGIGRVLLVTGDDAKGAALIGARLDLDGLEANVSPEGKLEIVQREVRRAPTLMIGDGINDAAALAGATVGMAMGARGSAAAAEAAEVVVLVDKLSRVPEAIAVARDARRIALQSVLVGIGLSLVGMSAAALGYIEPLAGALLQEAIDVAVIVNALRALGPEWRSAGLKLIPAAPK